MSNTSEIIKTVADATPKVVEATKELAKATTDGAPKVAEAINNGADKVAQVLPNGDALTNLLVQTMGDIKSGIGSTIHTATDLVNKTVDVAMTQGADIVHQALVWYGVYYFILFLIPIVVFFVLKKVATFIFNTTYYANLPEQHVSMQDKQDIKFFIFIPACIIQGISLYQLNLQWLKIWIAPKLWLIEFAANNSIVQNAINHVVK